MHDYKNAIQVGNVDYMCPICKELLDPMEWFFMNSFEFVDVEMEKNKKGIKGAKKKVSAVDVLKKPDELSDFIQTGANDVHKQLKPLSKKEYDYYESL